MSIGICPELNNMVNVNVWVWGAKNNSASLLSRVLIYSKANFLGFIDNDQRIQNSNICGYKVYSPEDFLLSYSPQDMIFICSTSSKSKEEIEAHLLSFGIKHNLVSIEKLGIQGKWGNFITVGDEPKLISKCCNYFDFEQDWFKTLMKKLSLTSNRAHRKDWEFCFISHVLDTKKMLEKGKRGLGFAVGMEPLPSFFASKGCSIVASDLWKENEFNLWAQTAQNALGDKSKLYFSDIIKKDDFEERVSYINLDMNNIPDDIGEFDFCWSSCAIEHVGSLELSKQFMKNMIRVLRPGGLAVHTTEFNLWSNEDTIEKGLSVIYRKKDFEELRDWYEHNGCEIELSFKRGSRPVETYLPFPPYSKDDTRDHLNLIIDNYASTSYGIIVKKLEQ